LALSKDDASTAESLLREALALRRRVLGEEHPDVASLHNLGMARMSAGDYEEAGRLNREALRIERKTKGSGASATIGVLAVIEHYAGRYDAAEALYREALDADRKNLGERHTDVGLSMQNLAFLLHD
jgi:tetratricopeptide (TPR) repeat protein